MNFWWWLLRRRTQPPVISPLGGEHMSPLTVTITAEPDAVVFYTLDGTKPTKTQGIPYTGAIILRRWGAE